MTIEDLIAEGDKVVGRFTQSGTHQGVFMSAAPTGRQVQFTEIAILRVAGGRVVEVVQPDMLGLYRQLGLIRNRHSGGAKIGQQTSDQS